MVGLASVVCAAIACFWAPGVPVLAQRLMRVVATYLLFAFVLRAANLIWTNPMPGPNSRTAMPDLYSPSYESNLSPILLLASLGAFSMLFGVYVASWLSRKSKRSANLLPYGVSPTV